MRALRWMALGLGLVTGACSEPAPLELDVLLLTDYRAGKDFETFEASLLGEEETLTASPALHDLVPSDVLRWTRLEPRRPRQLQVRLRRADGVIVDEALYSFDHEVDYQQLVVLCRACAETDCGPGFRCACDASQSCVPEDDPDVRYCSTDAGCPARSPCGEARCRAGVCFEELVDANCGLGEACEPEGCVGGRVDVPPADATVVAGPFTARGSLPRSEGVTGVRIGGVEARSADGFATFEAELTLEPGETQLDLELFGEGGERAEASGPTVRTLPLLPDKWWAFARAPDRDYALVELAGVTTVVEVDLEAGTAAPLFALPGSGCRSDARDLHYDETSARLLLVGLGVAQVCSVDPTTGRGERLVLAGWPGRWYTAFDPASRTLYGIEEARGGALEASALEALAGGPALVSSAEARGSGPSIEGARAIAWDAASERVVLYVVNRVDGEPLGQLIAVDPATGDRELVRAAPPGDPFWPPVGVFELGVRMAIPPTGGLAYLGDPGWSCVVQVDLETGAAAPFSGECEGTLSGEGPPLVGADQLHAFTEDAVWAVDPSRLLPLRLDRETAARSPAFAEPWQGEGPGLRAVSSARSPTRGFYDPFAERLITAGRTDDAWAVIAVDPASGRRSALVSVPESSNGVLLLVPDPDDRLGASDRFLIVQRDDDCVRRFDAETGGLSAVSCEGQLPALGEVVDARRSPDGSRLVVLDADGQLVEIDLASGARTDRGTDVHRTAIGYPPSGSLLTLARSSMACARPTAEGFDIAGWCLVSEDAPEAGLGFFVGDPTARLWVTPEPSARAHVLVSERLFGVPLAGFSSESAIEEVPTTVSPHLSPHGTDRTRGLLYAVGQRVRELGGGSVPGLLAVDRRSGDWMVLSLGP